jgi:hypothetical protein
MIHVCFSFLFKGIHYRSVCQEEYCSDYLKSSNSFASDAGTRGLVPPSVSR